MNVNQTPESDRPGDDAPRPFLAPCRIVPATAPFRWLAAGWKDLRAAPRQSLSWGLVVFSLSLSIGTAAYALGSLVMLLTMMSGFVLIGPLLAIALYTISWRLDRGRAPSFRRSTAEIRRQLGNCAVYALVLMVVFLVWARAGSMVHVFFPVEAEPDWRKLITFLGIGSAVGSIFAVITFSASAFSLPMLMHRDVDSITAVVTSINAVLRNKLAMAIWLAVIVAGLLVGTATLFVGLVFILPVIGYGAWHGYLETIDAQDFPRHQVGITSVPRETKSAELPQD